MCDSCTYGIAVKARFTCFGITMKNKSQVFRLGVASVSRIDKIIGLFCKRAL